MKQSQQVQEWQAEALKKGEQIGALRNMRNLLLRALELRTRGPVPPDLKLAIAEQAEFETLYRWFEVTKTGEAIADFRTAVGKAPPGGR